MSNHTLLLLIPSLPLVACLLVATFGTVLREKSHWPVIAAFIGSFICSLMLLNNVQHAIAAAGEHAAGIGYEDTFTVWTWVHVPDAYQTSRDVSPSDFTVDIVFRADPLTCMMLAMVTFVSSLVAIYSAGYMHGDPGYWRFFAYIALFVFSMTMLVSVSNFVLLYCFWEAVGACSYLLIGFWYQKPAAAAAGKKAFLVNRVGDFGFALGLFLLWTTYGTLNFHDTMGSHGEVHGILGQWRLEHGAFVSGGVGIAICLLLLMGACGKSAQFPLHVWLPDAMEGPTPVSALIHAATMVTAGIYMIARCTPLYAAAAEGFSGFGAQQAVAVIGCFTALLAALIALTQTDLKRVMAYSTLSQLGYMFLSLGTGTLLGITSGMFHLFTHAFFKALLFLGCGSVMHAMGGVIDMRRFGGLKKLMPYTRWTFLIGCLALAGIFPFAGFWSKDEILASVHDKMSGGANQSLYAVLYYAAVVTAGLTAFYTFRAYFMTFHGPERVPEEAGHHAHESPASMTGPLAILAVCALLVGAYFGIGKVSRFEVFLENAPSLAYLHHQEQNLKTAANLTEAEEQAFESRRETEHHTIAIVSSLIALAGIGLAAMFYLGDRKAIGRIANALAPAYKLSRGKFFIDEIYNTLIVFPLFLLAQASYLFDRWIVDGLVNLVGAIPPLFAGALRSLQSGLVQFYAMAMVLAVLVLIGALLMWQ